MPAAAAYWYVVWMEYGSHLLRVRARVRVRVRVRVGVGLGVRVTGRAAGVWREQGGAPTRCAARTARRSSCGRR